MYTLLAVVAVLTSLFVVRNVDLRVYWYGVNGFFAGIRPAYGPGSGLGFPMEYRYPPVTYILLFPLKWMSLGVAGFWWMLAAWSMVLVAVSLAIRMRRLRFSRNSILAAGAFMLAYVVLAIRYGNVQPFVIAWIFAALVLSETYPVITGILLALAVTFKIWPVMFLPWLFHRERRKAIAYFVVWFVALWMLPVPIFGATRYWDLLKEWYTAVGRVGTTYSEFYYFPGQSLRGLLLRYFTPVPPPLKNFPDVHVLSLSPHSAVIAWMVIGIGVYSLFVIQMLRSDSRKLWAWDGLAFVLYSMLEPYAVKSGLISLGPAALTGACLLTLGTTRGIQSTRNSWANRLFLAACAISFFEAILQYKPWQRFLLSIGLDFWAEALLLAALFIWIVLTDLPEST
ncbi:MAG: glycosyltransferase family 87 protein [Bryobacteraceae bacterium]